MKNSKPLVIAVVGVVVVVIVALVVVSLRSGGGVMGGVPGAKKGGDAFRPENQKALSTVQGGTREQVAEKIATPGEHATTISKDVAVPTTVVQTGPSSFRHFDISASGDTYSPSKIVVNDGDVVDLNFSATDKAYDIFFPDFGVYKAAAKGETVKLQFQGSPFGQYKFVCKNSCGSANVEGLFIVNKK